MNSLLLLDTDILIDFLRARQEALAFLDSVTDRPMVSVITVTELYAGVRDGIERTTLETLLRGLEILIVSESIAVRGGLLRRQYGKSHGVGILDALIAATAESARATMVTLYRKHFPMLTSVYVPYQKQL